MYELGYSWSKKIVAWGMGEVGGETSRENGRRAWSTRTRGEIEKC